MEAAESLQDYLKQQDALDKEARELFPYDFSACSLEQGYVKQQVFACLTCGPDAAADLAADAMAGPVASHETVQRGGVCYACSIACHGDHELVELFNKRHFRCDCGSARVHAAEPCTLLKARRPVNAENRYNQNYAGLFCWCQVAYDPEKESRTMFQCLQCEDWFHDGCIKAKEDLPDEALFDQFICRTCVAQMAWLKRYVGQTGFDARAPPMEEEGKDDLEQAHEEEDERPAKRLKTEASPGATEEPELCRWRSLPDTNKVQSLFLQESFRQALCSCNDCVQRAAPYPFLQEEEEVYDPPEDEGDDDADSVYEAGTRAMAETLDRMPRDKAIEGVLQFNRLKEHLTRCLRPLAEQGEIVTADHVRAFFAKQ